MTLCTESAPDHLIDRLQFEWCSFLDECEQRSERQGMLALWSFLLWGRSEIVDVIDEFEDVDVRIAIEQAFDAISGDFPMDPLLYELERLQRAVPPPDVPLAIPASVQDPRNHRPLEPTHGSFHFCDDLLSTSLDPAIVHWPRPRGVPVCRFPDGSDVLVLLHLFSGRRRDGDCHFWAQQLFSQYFPDMKLCVLSLDTAVDPDLCNLADGPCLNALLRIVDAKVVAGSLAGPPCETWSAARHVPAPPGFPHRWPRPLRSADRPWGLCGLSVRELHQLSLGSKLMFNNVKIELRVYLGGGATGMEHPAPPIDDTFASVWRTQLQAKFCMRSPGAQQIVLQQWRFGASCVKPTTLRLLGLPPSSNVLHAEEIPGLSKPQTVLEGFDTLAQRFRTAEAKEYPAGLCRALIITMFHGLRQRLHQEGARVQHFSDLRPADGQWMLRVAHASGTAFASTFLPDYQPNRGG
eukprot:s148_g3.t1